MNVPIWMTREDALALHDMMLAQHGGLAGVREMGLLDSALARPRHLSSYGRRQLPKLSAVYAGGIVRHHPFNDGNKRTGFLIAATFLEVNGYEFRAPGADVVLSTVALAANKMSEADYADWLGASAEARN